MWIRGIGGFCCSTLMGSWLLVAGVLEGFDQRESEDVFLIDHAAAFSDGPFGHAARQGGDD